MKKYLSIILLAGVLGFVFYGCEKDPDLRMPDLKKAVTPQLLFTDNSDILIDFYNPLDFQGEFTVDYYWDADPAESMDVYVAYNQDIKNKALFQADITTFPTTLQFNVQDLIDLLPNLNNVSQLTYNDRFDFYADITMKDGTVLNGSDTLYAIGSSDINNYPGGGTTLYVGFKCTYDPLMAAGSYYALSPADQWNSKGNITIAADLVDPTKVYVTGIEAIEGVVEDNGPLMMQIDPETFEVTVPKHVVATSAFGYHNLAYEGSGTFASCTGKYDMVFSITVDEGSFGEFKFSFTRN